MMDFHLSPDEINAWVNRMLDKTIDEMYREEREITPDTLHLFFEEHYNVPLPVYVADTWLRQQTWYIPKENS